MHHNNYGRPWILGRYQFQFLLERGLAPAHKILDFGCGAGRLAIHLVRYLDTGRYCGMDSNAKSAEAFAYEMQLHGLMARRPRFVLDSRFNFHVFGERFDFIVDFYTMKHLDQEAQFEAFSRFAKVLAPGGRVLVAPMPRLGAEELRDLGFGLVYSREQHCPPLEESRFKETTPWFEYMMQGLAAA